MSHEFELHKEIDIPATPEQVWAAIATGPGVDSWFMGRTEIEAGAGGETRFTMLGQTSSSTITSWEPGVRFGHRSEQGADGSFMAFDYLIEARAGGSTGLRLVQSGVLGGEDWEAEYQAMQAGWPMYLESLVAYLTYFPGRTATPVTALHPGAGDPATVWARLVAELGVTGSVAEGVPAHVTVAGLPAADGVIDCVSLPHYLGIRTSDALYRFVHSGVDRGNVVVIGHHLFGAADPDRAATAWQSWLTNLFTN